MKLNIFIDSLLQIVIRKQYAGIVNWCLLYFNFTISSVTLTVNLNKGSFLSLDSYLLDWFHYLGPYAIILSIIISIIISILGVVPSYFLTFANIYFFGFQYGLLISIIGETLGAIISFYLYRKGADRVIEKQTITNQFLITLSRSKGIKAFFLIIALRIFPFIPSGFVTLAGAISSTSLLNFSIASTIGKIPSLLIEAYSIEQLLIWDWRGKLMLCFLSIVLVYFLYKKKK